MRMLDCVELVAEKECYAKEGIHKGMQGWICDPRSIDGTWLVNFPQYGEKENIGTEAIQEEDLKQIPVMDARVNERIREEFGE